MPRPVSGAKGPRDLSSVRSFRQTKAAIYAVKAFFNAQPEKTVPIMISVTFPDMSGRLLSGQTPAAFWNSIAHAEPLIVGVNCGRRFKEIRPFVEELANNANCYLSGHFNAGFPNAFGECDEAPDDMFDDLNGFAERGFLNAVGGCCGSCWHCVCDSIGNPGEPSLAESSVKWGC